MTLRLLTGAAAIAMMAMVATPSEARPRHHHYVAKKSYAKHYAVKAVKVVRHVRRSAVRAVVAAPAASSFEFGQLAAYQGGPRGMQVAPAVRAPRQTVFASAAVPMHTTSRTTRSSPAVPMAPPPSAPAGPISSLVSVAQRYLGTNPGGWRFAWCGAFVDRVVQEAGYRKYPGNGLWAPNWKNYGSQGSGSTGDIAVMRGHVAIVYANPGNGTVQIIGGNQGRGGVNVLTVAASSIVAFRRPG